MNHQRTRRLLVATLVTGLAIGLIAIGLIVTVAVVVLHTGAALMGAILGDLSVCLAYVAAVASFVLLAIGLLIVLTTPLPYWPISPTVRAIGWGLIALGRWLGGQ